MIVVNVPNNKHIVLKPWHKVVSIKEKPIELELNGDSFIYRSVSNLNNCRGVYAKFDEGAFVFFKNADCLYIGWQKNLVSLNEVDKFEWNFSWHSRCFKAFNSERVVLKADYHTYRRFLINPFRLLSEILIPDDDWYYVADLPQSLYYNNKEVNLSDWLENIIQI